jgi:hypothetical protein
MGVIANITSLIPFLVSIFIVAAIIYLDKSFDQDIVKKTLKKKWWILALGLVLTIAWNRGIEEDFEAPKDGKGKDKDPKAKVMTPKELADLAAKKIQDQVAAMKKIVEDAEKEKVKKAAADKAAADKENANKPKEVALTPAQVAAKKAEETRRIEEQIKTMKKAVEAEQKRKAEVKKIAKK